MSSKKLTMSISTVALLVCVCQASRGFSSEGYGTATHAMTTSAKGDDTASIPDFDGDGTIGFGDFLLFAEKFGTQQGDGKYQARFDLDSDGSVGFSDFVIFAQNFGKVASPVVAIPDANLRAAIEEALGKASGAPITQAEMATLDSLEASDADISDLTGLESATNLTWLDLASNNIADISALAGLTNLTDVTLTANNISDLASLAANTGLGRGGTVDVKNNPLNAASHSTHIPALQARGVSVSFDVLVTIPDANLRAVIEAALDKARDAPITQAEMATMDSLTANKRGISDLTGLEYATNLTWLDLASNNITDISVLEGLTNLTDVTLTANNISDLASLAANTGLGRGGAVDVKNNPLNAASHSTHIPALQARGVSVSFDVPSPVVAIPDANLRTAIEDALGKAGGTPITQAEMVTLDSLEASDADISDLTGLQSATNLTWLDLGRNNITDISALSGLANLTVLILESNHISDLSPLVANTGLDSGDTVNFVRNPLDIASKSTDIPALRARGVNVSFDEVSDNTEPEIYNDNVFILPVQENLAALWTNNGSRPPLQDYTARFYEHFNDEFDFLIFFPNVLRLQLEPGAIQGAYYGSVKNATKGIGVPIFSDNSRWGSAERIQGVIFFNYNDPSMFRGLLLHELMHRWGNFVVPITSMPYGPHWGLSTSGGYLDCYDISNWIDHGDGKYSAPDLFYIRSSEQFSPIELYLAGFIPPEDVPDFQVAEDGKWLSDERGDIVKDDNGYRMFTASGFKTHTIEDIIAKHGRRDPNHVQSQKDFRAAVILLIGEDYPATREILESLSADVLWFSHAGKDESGPPVTNFYEATGGRGTITMDGLSQFQRPAGANKPAASSFGTPPPPIVDHWK